MPFARYVLENAGKLTFPFRRYQIQKVWRGERPQEGRYREFCQADIDVVGIGELPFHHDVEIAQVMAEALSALPLPPVTLQLNNRRLIEGFYRGPRRRRHPGGDARHRQAGQDPPPSGGRAAADHRRAVDGAGAGRCLDLAAIASPDTSFAERVQALG